MSAHDPNGSERTLAEEREWFCPECGITGPEMSTIDEDGCCAVCGASCCRLSELRALLVKSGLHLVTDAEKRVLEAMAAIEIKVLEAIRDKWSCAPLIFHPPCLAELARRGEKDDA